MKKCCDVTKSQINVGVANFQKDFENFINILDVLAAKLCILTRTVSFFKKTKNHSFLEANADLVKRSTF